MRENWLSALEAAIYEGDNATAASLVKEGLQSGMQPNEIITKGLTPAMQKVGDAYTAEEIYLPEMLVSADAMNTCLGILQPLLKGEESKGIGIVVIGTVLGDVHDIGKNIVAWMLEGAGFRVVDLGVDVPPQTFLEAVKKEQPDLVALSALLTTSSHQMVGVISTLKEAGLREKVKILIGGASVNQGFADEIGADGYALDAVRGVAKVKALLGLGI
jgi:5-methyltetrahydrofolate--homocysteine methyltransferase